MQHLSHRHQRFSEKCARQCARQHYPQGWLLGPVCGKPHRPGRVHAAGTCPARRACPCTCSQLPPACRGATPVCFARGTRRGRCRRRLRGRGCAPHMRDCTAGARPTRRTDSYDRGQRPDLCGKASTCRASGGTCWGRRLRGWGCTPVRGWRLRTAGARPARRTGPRGRVLPACRRASTFCFTRRTRWPCRLRGWGCASMRGPHLRTAGASPTSHTGSCSGLLSTCWRASPLRATSGAR